MQDPFAKYADHYHASLFAGEYRRDNQGGNDATLVLAAWAAMLEDLKRLAAGKEPLAAHRPAPPIPSPETPAGRTRREA